MTPAEREAEIASILARGVVRAVRATRGSPKATQSDDGEHARSLGDRLELSPDAALSVATRPAGLRLGADAIEEIPCPTRCNDNSTT